MKKNGIAGKTADIATDDLLRHLAFDNSLLANIISNVSSGNIIMANDAARKLLGYSKKEILTKSRSTIFNINETGFKKMLKERTAEGHSVALVTAIKKSGKAIPCEITSAVFLDGDGIEKAITTITDMSGSILKQKEIDSEKEKIVAENIAHAKSEQKEIDTSNEKMVADNILEAKSKQKKIDIQKEKIVAGNIILAQEKSDSLLADNTEWIKYIAKTSYDVMWDWDIATGQVYVGDSIEEVFGYKVPNNTVQFTDLTDGLLEDENGSVRKNLADVLASGKKSWNDSYRIRRKDGSAASVISRASIIRDSNGNALRLIGATQDVSKIRELEKKLEGHVTATAEYTERFNLASGVSFDIIWDWNIITGELYMGEGFEELFGYTLTNNKGNIADWRIHIHPDDRKDVEESICRAIASSAENRWAHSYRYIRADGSIAQVYDRASIMRHADGKAYRMIGSIQDTSNRGEPGEKITHEIRLKEKQMEEAVEEARQAERSDIGKELHDNVNQLLSVSKMYLDLAKRGGENSEVYLTRSSQYTISAIEEIRKLTKGLTTDIIKNLGLGEAIDNLVQDTMEISPVKISFKLKSFREKTVNDKFKLNIFRIIQEQMNNILKHARATEVVISLSQDKKAIILTVSDNGIGFDTGKSQKGIGIENIRSRAENYKGNAAFVSAPGKGCILTVNFPFTGTAVKKNEP